MQLEWKYWSCFGHRILISTAGCRTLQDDLKDSLIIFLDSGGCHAVDDGISAWVHWRDGVTDGQQWEGKNHAEPQDDVKDDRIVLGIGLGEVETLGLKR